MPTVLLIPVVNLPMVSLILAAILPPVSLTTVANLPPPVSLIPVVHLDLRISLRIFNKTVLMGYSGARGKLIHEKTRSKKSRDTVPLILICHPCCRKCWKKRQIRQNIYGCQARFVNNVFIAKSQLIGTGGSPYWLSIYLFKGSAGLGGVTRYHKSKQNSLYVEYLCYFQTKQNMKAKLSVEEQQLSSTILNKNYLS